VTTWTGTCRSAGMAVLGLGLTLVLLGIGVFVGFATRGTGATWVGWFVAIVGVLVGLLVVLMSRLEVRVETDRVVVAYGRVGWPRRTVRLDQVRAVAHTHIDPMEWGGWGYRWIPWAHATAAVLRGGPGIVLTLEDERRFAVTVDDAHAGAVAIGHALEALRGR